jgi:hypothetical protein
MGLATLGPEIGIVYHFLCGVILLSAILGRDFSGPALSRSQVLMLNNKDNAEQLSRLSIYVTYMLVGQMARPAAGRGGIQTPPRRFLLVIFHTEYAKRRLNGLHRPRPGPPYPHRAQEERRA